MVFIGAFWYFPAIRAQQGDHADIFAHLISEQKEKINSLATILRIGILYVIPMFLVAWEPDLSTTMVFAFFVLYIDVCWRYQL